MSDDTPPPRTSTNGTIPPPPPSNGATAQPGNQPASTAGTIPPQPPGNGATVQPGSEPAASKAKRYVSELSHPGDPPPALPTEFAEAVLQLEKLLGMPVWLFIQNGAEHDLCSHIEDMFFGHRHALPQGKPIALLIESPGGDAACAYRISKLLQRRCGSFTAIVVNWAKSAATLLALGASEIILGERGQLGPLDVQVYDPSREEQNSALNETQALERLHAAGLEALVNTLYVLRQAIPPGRTPRKRYEALLPHALKFVAESMRPIYEKVDVVQYTARLRDLKVAEEYAVRLLSPKYHPRVAEQLARCLVERYPDHAFVIDFDEAKDLGLNVKEPTLEQSEQLDKILLHITDVNAFGRVVEA